MYACADRVKALGRTVQVSMEGQWKATPLLILNAGGTSCGCGTMIMIDAGHRNPSVSFHATLPLGFNPH